jgi:signal peptidase I
MNWELIGWLALAASGLVILASFFMGRARAGTAPVVPAGAAPEPHPIHAWLEIAWPVFFIAIMGMLTLKEVMGFPAVLLLATVLTGIVWVVDALALKKWRANKSTEPVVVEMARSFFPVILIVFVLRSFLYEPFKIPSESMVPTLVVGDFILVNKFTYGVRLPVINKKIVDVDLPKRGDVMVFRYPENTSLDFIKRVVGIPGDKIVYRNKRLTINDQPVPTEQLDSQTRVDDKLAFQSYDVIREKLGEKMHTSYLDPRAQGVRLGGVREFPNRANCAYNDDQMTCTVPAGHYFMMGDNRDNSEDSRYWGFVPEANIVGKAVLIWMNFGSMKRVGTSIE